MAWTLFGTEIENRHDDNFPRVVMMPPLVFIMTTCCATSENKVGIRTTLASQWVFFMSYNSHCGRSMAGLGRILPDRWHQENELPRITHGGPWSNGPPGECSLKTHTPTHHKPLCQQTHNVVITKLLHNDVMTLSALLALYEGNHRY